MKIWSLWKERNDRCFDKISRRVSRVYLSLELSKGVLDDWLDGNCIEVTDDGRSRSQPTPL